MADTAREREVLQALYTALQFLREPDLVGCTTAFGVYMRKDRAIEAITDVYERVKRDSHGRREWGSGVSGCPVCGIGSDGKPYAYACQRNDCPTGARCLGGFLTDGDA